MTRNTIKPIFVDPSYSTHPLYAEWNDYLAENLGYTEDDFGGGYAWANEPPARETWAEVVAEIREHCDREWKGLEVTA